MVNRQVFAQVDGCATGTRIGCRDGFVESLIAGAANLDNKLAFLDAVCSIGVLDRNVTILEVAVVDVLIECTAGNLEVVRSCIA